MISKKTEKEILKNLPYSKPFLFVDRIIDINENEITGKYTFQKNEDFYNGHFKNNAITPGVLLIETMGQIGLVCFGIFLLKIHLTKRSFTPFLSHIDADLLAPVYPGETVTVHAEKVYFKNNILKCKIKMVNAENITVLTKTSICAFKFNEE